MNTGTDTATAVVTAAPIFGSADTTSSGGGRTTQEGGPGTERKRDATDTEILAAVRSALHASSVPLDIEAIGAEVNAHGERSHVATGPIKSALAILQTAGAVVVEDSADPSRAKYALSAAAREELDSPGRTKEARAAVVTVLWGETSYLDCEAGGSAVLRDFLSKEEIAHAIARANTDKGPEVDGDFRRSFLGGQNPETAEGMLALSTGAGGACAALEGQGLAEPGEGGYRLTPVGKHLFLLSGATALADRTIPRPSTPSVEEQLAEATATSCAQVADATKRTDAAIAQRDDALKRASLYERWFAEKGIESPATLIAESLRGKEGEKTFTWKKTVTMEGAELRRAIDEMRELRALIARREDEIKSEKKRAEAALDLLRTRHAGVTDMVENHGTHTVVKQAFARIVEIDGVPMREVCSAEEQDYGTRLDIEPLKAGTQVGIAGAAPPSTPVIALAAAATPKVESVTTPTEATQPPAPEGEKPPAPPPDPPAHTGPKLGDMRPQTIRAFVVEHVLPKAQDGILLDAIPDAIIDLAGLTFADAESRASTVAMLRKGAESARVKGLVDEEITPKGPAYKPKAARARDESSEGESAEPKGEEGKAGQRGRRSGKAEAGTA